MMNLYDPEGVTEGQLPPDREPYTSLVKAVLALQEPGIMLQSCDYEQIALQLTGHARVVASEVRHLCEQLPADRERRVLAEVVLTEADGHLARRPRGSLRCVRERARLVRALYERFDRLRDAADTSAPR